MTPPATRSLNQTAVKFAETTKHNPVLTRDKCAPNRQPDPSLAARFRPLAMCGLLYVCAFDPGRGALVCVAGGLPSVANCLTHIRCFPQLREKRLLFFARLFSLS